MLALTQGAMAAIGLLLAGWLMAAAWAVWSGVRMRRSAAMAQEEADRLARLLQTAPAVPVTIRGDGRLEGPDRLRVWLGLDVMPAYASELTAEGGCLRTEDARLLAADLMAAQRAGKSFSRPVSAAGSNRTLLIRGGPADPSLSAPGAASLWVFDATETQSEILALQDERDHLRGALEALSGLIEAAPMPMWHRDAQMRLDLVNTAYVKCVDAADAAHVIEDGVELIETVEGYSPASAAATALREGAALSRVVPATIDGERRAMRVVDVPLGDAGVAGFAIDMHELEVARAEYRRLLQAQRDMLDRLSAGVVQFGPDRLLQFANQPFLALFGLQADQISDAPEFDRLLDWMREKGRLPEVRDFPAWRSEHDQWFFSPEAREESWVLPDGTHLRVFAQPLPDGGLLLIFEDRTEQIQLSSARDTLLRVRTATFDNLFEAVGVFASDGRLSLWNNRFRRIWNVDENILARHPRVDDLMAHVASSLARPDQANLVQELVRAATLERRQRGGRVIFADGRHFEFAAIPLPDGNALFAMLDITDSRRIEQALRDRNEALEEGDRARTAFLSNMSYELRTPLTSIAGFAEMLGAGYAGALSEQAEDYVRAIVESTGRLASLIDRVLDLSQGEAGVLPLERKPLALEPLVRQNVEGFAGRAADRDIALVVQLEPTLGTVTADPRRIGQALEQLVENALLYSGQGGRVLVHGEGDSEMARIVVSDNGPGMDEQTQRRAFESKGGSGDALGIGLPLARKLVEAHGGTLELISRVGEGTLVTISLPRT